MGSAVPPNKESNFMRFLTNYLRAAAFGTTALALVGCGTIQPQAIDTKHLESLKNQTVVVTTRDKPDSVMTTPGSATFGLIGAFAAIAAGNKLAAENNLQDPADALSAGLVRVLETHQGTRLVAPGVPASTNDVQQLAAAAKGKAKFMLDVQSMGWHAIYFPTAWGRYRVIYSARARLINVDTQSVIAEGACRRAPDQSDRSPTYDQLWASQAAMMKSELGMAARECLQTIAMQMFPTAGRVAVAPPAAPAVAVATPDIASAASSTANGVAATAPAAANPEPAAVAVATAVAPAGVAPNATTDKLRQLQKLYEGKQISADEYGKRRREILSGF